MQFGRGKPKRGGLATLNMSSMIDVTFLLLIYFIVSTVFSLPEDQLTPALEVEQGSSSVETDLEPQIVVSHQMVLNRCIKLEIKQLLIDRNWQLFLFDFQMILESLFV